MIESTWFQSLVVALVVFHALALYYAYKRTASEAATGTGDDAQNRVDADAGIVECPACGTDNEFGYQYCRACVADLEGTPGFAGDANRPHVA
jgi:uncharacterized protein (UPF0212 family)